MQALDVLARFAHLPQARKTTPPLYGDKSAKSRYSIREDADDIEFVGHVMPRAGSLGRLDSRGGKSQPKECLMGRGSEGKAAVAGQADARQLDRRPGKVAG